MEDFLFKFDEQTPWNRVVLDKLIVTQLIKKFLGFYGTRMLINVFTDPYPELDESSSHPYTPLPFSPILILFPSTLKSPKLFVPFGFSD
jgi:hypothetical protein